MKIKKMKNVDCSKCFHLKCESATAFRDRYWEGEDGPMPVVLFNALKHNTKVYFCSVNCGTHVVNASPFVHSKGCRMFDGVKS